MTGRSRGIRGTGDEYAERCLLARAGAGCAEPVRGGVFGANGHTGQSGEGHASRLSSLSSGWRFPASLQPIIRHGGGPRHARFGHACSNAWPAGKTLSSVRGICVSRSLFLYTSLARVMFDSSIRLDCTSTRHQRSSSSRRIDYTTGIRLS